MKVAVVIPCYKCKSHIRNVISTIDNHVDLIILVDDACPERTGQWVKENHSDPRLKVIFHDKNLGVGGAVMTGYREALNASMDIAVKIDGDGQMDPALIPHFIKPIIRGQADYTKGNRFSRIEHMKGMPLIRIFGNISLSFVSKMSTGYWKLLDPTNGYTALNLKVFQLLDSQKISSRYFFESDLLFRLGLLKAVITDIPMQARYADEISNLRISKVTGEFALKHLRNFMKRIFYQYFLLDFNIASIELVFGLIFMTFGTSYGILTWIEAYQNQRFTPQGSIMLASLPILLGFQMFLGFLNYDMNKDPYNAISKMY